MKRALALFAAAVVLSGASLPLNAAPAKPTALPMPELTIYHLEGRRSERIVWLMEELQMPYKLVFERGSLAGSMPLSCPTSKHCRRPPSMPLHGVISV